MVENMELEFEHIDWDDIVEAELSGDSDTLQKLRSACPTGLNNYSALSRQYPCVVVTACA